MAGMWWSWLTMFGDRKSHFFFLPIELPIFSLSGLALFALEVRAEGSPKLGLFIWLEIRQRLCADAGCGPQNPHNPAPSSRSLYICSRVPRADECERAWRIERNKFSNSAARPGTSLVLKTRKPTRTRKNTDPIKVYSRSTSLLLPSWPMMWAVRTSWTKVWNDMMCSHRACKYNTGGGGQKESCASWQKSANCTRGLHMALGWGLAERKRRAEERKREGIINRCPKEFWIEDSWITTQVTS